jgi:hypothetical protein
MYVAILYLRKLLVSSVGYRLLAVGYWLKAKS